MILRALALLCLALALMACREEKAAPPPPARPVLSVVVQPQAQGARPLLALSSRSSKPTSAFVCSAA